MFFQRARDGVHSDSGKRRAGRLRGSRPPRFVVPAHPFFVVLMCAYGVQLHDLPLNSVQHQYLGDKVLHTQGSTACMQAVVPGSVR